MSQAALFNNIPLIVTYHYYCNSLRLASILYIYVNCEMPPPTVTLPGKARQAINGQPVGLPTYSGRDLPRLFSTAPSSLPTHTLRFPMVVKSLLYLPDPTPHHTCFPIPSACTFPPPPAPNFPAFSYLSSFSRTGRRDRTGAGRQAGQPSPSPCPCSLCLYPMLNR